MAAEYSNAKNLFEYACFDQRPRNQEHVRACKQAAKFILDVKICISDQNGRRHRPSSRDVPVQCHDTMQAFVKAVKEACVARES